MGSWGSGIFENDDAQDWLAGFVRQDTLEPIHIALAEVRRLEGHYLDCQRSFEALAAAEVVSALRGYPSKDLPQKLRTWLVSHPLQIADDLVKEAMIVVVRILRDSELRDVSENMENVPMELYRVVGDLMSRLK